MFSWNDQRTTTPGCKDIGFRKSGIVAEIQFPCRKNVFRFVLMSTKDKETTFNVHIPQKGSFLLEIGETDNIVTAY